MNKRRLGRLGDQQVHLDKYEKMFQTRLIIPDLVYNSGSAACRDSAVRGRAREREVTGEVQRERTAGDNTLHVGICG